MEEKKWYILQVYSGSEDRVVASLKNNIEQNDLGDYFGSIIVPKEEVVEIRNGKRVRVNRCFFPGYVLVEMIVNQKTWHMIKQSPNIFGFVGGGDDQPVPLPQHEVEKIRKRIDDSHQSPVPKVLYEVGEVIRVVDGPFADFDGTIEDINYAKNSLRVGVVILGRLTPIELTFNQVLKI